MFTSPHECGLCTHHIKSSSDPGLLYLIEWLCPLCPSKHFLLDTPMLIYIYQHQFEQDYKHDSNVAHTILY